MTDNAKKPTLQEVRWIDVREKVAASNPEFAACIDNIDLSDKFPLYVAKYPFGSQLLEKGRFNIPVNGQLIDIEAPECPKDLQKKLDYNMGSVPLGIVLDHSMELYLEPEQRIIPFAQVGKGKIFGLWSALDLSLSYIAHKAWSIVAGSRSISILPKITDSVSYKKLCKARGIKRPLPATLLDHGPLLADIANHIDFPVVWHTEVLFFPKIWLEENTGEAWARFKLFLHESTWRSARYWCNKIVYDYVWHTFIKDLTEKNIRIMPHIIDIVDHILMVGLGILPGFAPAIDNEVGPIEGFQKDLVEIYGLKRFAPTIMIPKHLSETDGRTVYWSMQLPTHFETNSRPKKMNSIINDLREIRYLLRKLRSAVLAGNILAIRDTPLYNFMEKVNFEYFHSDAQLDDIILPSKNMIEKDNFLLEWTKFGEKGFSEVSPFIRGCLSISLKHD